MAPGCDRFDPRQIVPLDLGLSWHWAEENFDIYPMAGVTYAFVDAEAKGDIDVDVDDEWGAYAGLGLSYAFVENFALFTNVHYRFIDFDADSRNDLADFSKFDAYGLNVDVGVKFLF